LLHLLFYTLGIKATLYIVSSLLETVHIVVRCHCITDVFDKCVQFLY